MKKRYWEATETPGVILDWISKEVEDSTKLYWDGETPITWCDSKDGRAVLVVTGPEKPDDGSGITDIYTISFDILENLTDWSKPYDDVGGPRSDAQREDLHERADVLRALSEDIARLADAAEKQANVQHKARRV